MALNKKTIDDINVKRQKSPGALRLQRTVKRWCDHR